ncbi:hypothetical protein DYB26_003627, partial [Aphanomyces astaci]
MQMGVAPLDAAHAEPSSVSITSRPWLRRCIFSFVVIKHIVSALYLVAQIAIIYKMDAAEKLATRVIAIPSTTVAYSVLAGLHMALLVQHCRHPRQTSRSSPDVITSSRLTRATLFRWLGSDGFMILYNVIELTCQSYEAFAISKQLVNHAIVATYVGFVALHAMVTPMFFATRHTATKIVMVNWTSSMCSFVTSSVVHIFGMIIPLARYVWLDPNLGRNPIFLVRGVKYARYNLVTSVGDWVAKCGIQLGSIVSLWRLVHSLRIASKAQRRGSPLTKQPSMQPSRPLLAFFRLNLYVRLYIVGSSLWGAVLLVSLAHTTWYRQPCPTTCQSFTTPLWDTTCQCLYAHVNCATLHVDDVDKALDASLLGQILFAILISRCDLPRGVRNATLHQFPALYYFGVKFTNTTSWTDQASLPPVVNVVAFRYMPLRTLPSILLENLPATLTSMTVSNLPLRDAFELPASWTSVTRLCLTNISLSKLSSDVLQSMDVNKLFLYHNALTTLPTRLQHMPKLSIVDVSGNEFTKAPWDLLNDQRRTLLLCDNPLDDPRVPDTIDETTRQAYIKTFQASCASPCAPQCYPHLVGDHECQLSCFNAACNYDDGDCDEFGFDRLEQHSMAFDQVDALKHAVAVHVETQKSKHAISIAPLTSKRSQQVVYLNAGGPVWAVDWYQPPSTPSTSYIALSAHPTVSSANGDVVVPNHSYNERYDGGNVVQIWAVSAKSKQHSSSLVLSIPHNGAFAWSLKWAPHVSACLGVLAAALGDGTLHLYRMLHDQSYSMVGTYQDPHSSLLSISWSRTHPYMFLTGRVD